MGRPRHTRKDSNQSEIVEELRSLNFMVIDVADFASAGCDIFVCGFHRRWLLPMWLAVEVKAPGGTLTKTEEERAAEMEYKFGDDAPYIVAYEPDDVLQWFGAL